MRITVPVLASLCVMVSALPVFAQGRKPLPVYAPISTQPAVACDVWVTTSSAPDGQSEVHLKVYLDGQPLNGYELPETYFHISQGTMVTATGKFDHLGRAVVILPYASYTFQTVVERYKRLVTRLSRDFTLTEQGYVMVFNLFSNPKK